MSTKPKKYAILNFLPAKKLSDTISKFGCTCTYEIAQALQISEKFLFDAIEFYKNNGTQISFNIDFDL